MKNFDIYFSKQWSFLFQDTCLTSRRLCEPYPLNWFPRLSASAFPRDFLPWETSASESCDTQPNCDTLFPKSQHSCHRFLFFLEIALFQLFIWLFMNLVLRKQTLVSSLTTRFNFIELALGRMPRFTRRSRTRTSQRTSARLSKNGPMVTYASDTFFLRHTSTSWYGWLRMRGGSVFWFFVHDLGSRDGSCNDLLANTGLLSFHW